MNLLSKHNDNAMYASYISLYVTKSEGGEERYLKQGNKILVKTFS